MRRTERDAEASLLVVGEGRDGGETSLEKIQDGRLCFGGAPSMGNKK